MEAGALVSQRPVDDHKVRRVAEGGDHAGGCLLYTSDAADERSSVDLGGRRIIKKKKNEERTTRVSPEVTYTEQSQARSARKQRANSNRTYK